MCKKTVVLEIKQQPMLSFKEMIALPTRPNIEIVQTEPPKAQTTAKIGEQVTTKRPKKDVNKKKKAGPMTPKQYVGKTFERFKVEESFQPAPKRTLQPTETVVEKTKPTKSAENYERNVKSKKEQKVIDVWGWGKNEKLE